jgi:catechol 2,3-dioxygenase-like lactoylglutathione lyase family enzyme
MLQTLNQTAPVENDFLPLNGTDHVEFYVGNARQSAHYYRSAFGFRLAAYRGPETGTPGRASYVLEQNKIRLVLSTPLRPDDPVANHLRLHGDGVRDIALWVDDAESAWRETTRRGARSVLDPQTYRDEFGEVGWRPSPRMATPFTPLSSASITAAHFFPVFARWRARTSSRARPVCSTSIIWWATSAGARWTGG